MDEQDTLEIAARNGLPWIDLSLIDPYRIESTETGPVLQLRSHFKIPLISRSDSLKHLMPNQVLAMSDQEHIDRFTVRGDDPDQLEFEDSVQDEHELT